MSRKSGNYPATAAADHDRAAGASPAGGSIKRKFFMRKPVKILTLAGTHLIAIGAGFALGIYVLPILTAPEGPDTGAVRSVAESSRFTGEFRRGLADSDALHWGEGRLFVGPDTIAFEGRLAPGPDYRLYLSPEFVETEAAFETLKSEMVQVGHVMTFENFMVAVPESVDPADFTAAIVWCESFGQFITAASYQ
jgi:hypothetical protein